jgi:sulfite dehydrogenase
MVNDEPETMVPQLNRRHVIAGIGQLLAATSTPAFSQASSTPSIDVDRRPLARYPQKRPLIRLTSRPPQLETPFSVFSESLITPNDAFFVRYHLAGLPLDLDMTTYRLKIGGHVDRPFSLTVDELKRDFPMQQIVAVNQCSGNSRRFVEPRVGGGQLGNGAMGNARWEGVALKALLERAGVQAGAKQVSFDGLDQPPADSIPDFIKALDIDHALDGEVMVAWGMNGTDLPFLNGYPLRLVVPGYYGTYWVKHLSEITILDTTYGGYWMSTAYRVPNNECACVPAGDKPQATRPISRLNIRSFVTSHAHGATVRAGRPLELRGIAFEGGTGIASVALSIDGGQSWRSTRLGDDLGRYSFREWRLDMPLPRGAYQILVRATSNGGETQPMKPLWQPSGYMRNVVEILSLSVA